MTRGSCWHHSGRSSSFPPTAQPTEHAARLTHALRVVVAYVLLQTPTPSSPVGIVGGIHVWTPGSNQLVVRNSRVVKEIVADLIEAIDDSHAVTFRDVGPYRLSITRKPVSSMVVMDDNVGNGFDIVIPSAFATSGSHVFRVVIDFTIRVTARATSKHRYTLRAQGVVAVVIGLIIISGAVVVWRLDVRRSYLPGTCCFGRVIVRAVWGDLVGEPPGKRCVCPLLPASVGFPDRSALCECIPGVSPRHSFSLRLSK